MATKAPRRDSSSSDSEEKSYYKPDTTVSGKSYDPRQEGAMYDPSVPDGIVDPYAPQADPARKDLRAAEENNGYYRDPNAQNSNYTDSNDLRDAESSASNNSYYNPHAKGPRFGKSRLYVRQNKKKVGIFGGVLGAGLTGILIAFFLMIPLKIEHMVSNLRDRFFSPSTAAVTGMSDTLLAKYLVEFALPEYKNCPKASTISSACKVRIVSPGTNPVRNLYVSWADQKIEHKLAQKGFEFEHKPQSNTWYLKAPGLGPNGESIGPNGEKFPDVMQRANRKELRAAFRSSMKEMTLRDRVMWRFQAGRMMEERAGLRSCIIFCGTKDRFDDYKAEKSKAAKIFLTERVIMPREESIGIALTCLLNDCDATDTRPTDESEAPGQNGRPENPETDGEIRNTLRTLAADYPNSNLDEIAKHFDEISTKGFNVYMIQRALVKAGLSRGAAQLATDSIPVIGWINLAAQVVNAAKDAGPNLRKLGYVANAAPAIAMFAMYQTYGDEVHTGNVDATELGSFVDSLGAGEDTKTDPSYGGTASAEDSPLYRELIGGGYTAPATNDSETTAKYKCKNGKPVPKGKLVCSEEVFSGGNGIANSVSDYLEDPNNLQVEQVVFAAGIWKSTVGWLTNLLGDALMIVVGPIMDLAGKTADGLCAADEFLPGTSVSRPVSVYCDGRDVAKKAIPEIAKAVTNALIPSPFSTNMSGGRSFNMIAAGADVSGNDYANTGLGAKSVDAQTAGKIIRQNLEEDKFEFSRRPFMARMFDTENRHSMVSNVAMATPFNLQASMQSGFASLLSNPMGVLGNSFGSLFTRKAAADELKEDPFGVTQYAYTEEDMAAIGDPEDYWNAHCSDNASHAYQNDADYAASNWNQEAADEGAKDESTTGLPENKRTNPCLLIKKTVGANGGRFDKKLLSDNERKNIPKSESDNEDSGSTGDAISDDAQTVAKEILANNNITYIYSAKEDVTLVSEGKKGTNNAPIDIRALQIVAALGKKHKVIVSAYESNGQGHSAGSDHYSGNAVDIANIDGQVASSNITDFFDEIKQYSSGAVFLQGHCSNKKVPTGMNRVNGDACNHQHISLK